MKSLPALKRVFESRGGAASRLSGCRSTQQAAPNEAEQACLTTKAATFSRTSDLVDRLMTLTLFESPASRVLPTAICFQRSQEPHGGGRPGTVATPATGLRPFCASHKRRDYFLAAS